MKRRSLQLTRLEMEHIMALNGTYYGIKWSLLVVLFLSY